MATTVDCTSRFLLQFHFLIGAFILAAAWPAHADLSNPADWPARPAVSADDSRIVGWATGVAEFQPGPQAVFAPAEYGEASFGSPGEALGPADVTLSGDDPNTYTVVSLGDGGWITLTFANAIRDGAGPDIAVFENSFSDGFLELAFVEVSSDGTHFTRFPAVSLTPTDNVHENLEQDDFSTLDPANLYDLAGKYRGGLGTPFDLHELADTPGLDLNHIVAVRVRDVVGSVDDRWATYDSLGHKIKDPFPTVFPSGGFDLDAVAVLNQVPEPSSIAFWWAGAALLHSRRRRGLVP